MTKMEIDAIRKWSKAKSEDTPWFTDYDAMALKTVVRRAAKFWPLTTASPELSDAIQMNDENEFVNIPFEESLPPGKSASASAVDKLLGVNQTTNAEPETLDVESDGEPHDENEGIFNGKK